MPETIEAQRTEGAGEQKGAVYVTPDEAARRLRVNAKTIRAQLASRTLRGVRIGRVWRVQWPPQNV